MKSQRGRPTLKQIIRSNALAERGMAAMAGVPVRAEVIAMLDDLDAAEARRLARPPRKPSSRPRETPIKWDICKAIKAHPKVAWAAVFNRGMAREGNRRVPYNYAKGFSDIAGQLIDGRFLALEIKRDHKGGVTAQQMDFILKVHKNNGVAAIVWSVEMALKVLDAA